MYARRRPALLVLVSVALGIAWAPTLAAQADSPPSDFSSGNFFLGICATAVDLTDIQKTKPTLKTAFQAGVCSGFLEGVDQMKYLYEGSPFLFKRSDLWFYCKPAAVTNGQRNLVFLTYLRKHPEELHKEGVVLAVESFAEAWPCTAK